MEYNQQPPVTSAPPPYMQQQRGQANVITNPKSLEEIAGYIARGAAILTTFLATVIIGTANQTKDEITLKFSLLSALKYFLAVNIIVLIYSIASLLISIIVKPKPFIITLSIAIVDIIAVCMLLTANGAAIAISRQLDDADHLFEKILELIFGTLLQSSICSFYGRLCSQIKASIAMSMLASGIYAGLIVLTLVISAYKKS